MCSAGASPNSYLTGLVGSSQRPATVTTEPPIAPAPAGLTIRCPRCGGGQTVASWSLLLGHVLENDPLRCHACGVEMSSVSVYADATKIDIGTLVDRLDQRARQGAHDNPLPPVA